MPTPTDRWEESPEGREARHEHLIEGFVGNDPMRQRLYMTSATFKQAVDTLAHMAPAWMDGLAAMAESEEAKMRDAMEAMERTPRVYGFRERS